MSGLLSLLLLLFGVLAVAAAYIVARSTVVIGPAQVGLVIKRVSRRHNTTDTPIAMTGEAGYQGDLLMPGVRFKLWPTYAVVKYPWVQVPAGEIGVVISQIGEGLPTGAKSAVYKPEFGNFTNLRAFLGGGGQKGVQRPVLPPGTLAPIHPVAFLVVTATKAYGLPIDAQLVSRGPLSPSSFGLQTDQFRVTVITPDGDQDVVGLVTTLEGEPLPPADIAGRIGGFADIDALEAQPGVTDSELIEALLGKKNQLHNNYQDFQAFLDSGGRIGLQHDALLYGAYLLNPFLVRVELAPMLVVNQGEVAVIKSYVGLPTLDTSGPDFKFGSIVQPGHRGIWREALRTGKYPLNPRIYAAEKVPTFILTLNWAEANSIAHNLDAQLSPIEGKSREGFVFKIDLQVQIHVPDTKAPKVISMVGSMENLVNEVLQAAVGNHFRNTLQGLEAVRFIETRDEVQAAALAAISRYLAAYEVETRGVYIQDVTFPQELVNVLTRREIANQEKATFEQQKDAQTVRIDLEKARGTAEMQAELAKAQVSVDINRARAGARKAEAGGEAAFVSLTGEAEGSRRRAIGLGDAAAVEALGLAKAKGYRAQVESLGSGPTAAIAVANALSEGKLDVMPDVLVTGGGGAIEGLAAAFMRSLNGSGNGDGAKPQPKKQ
ncbi:MAG TPA: SPFH domain-containing protein [Candidatus Dormibacteraeota bacterium]|nr:SPFH domain-containing protein [Candidatus Dormibacteraeota bacterium]